VPSNGEPSKSADNTKTVIAVVFSLLGAVLIGVVVFYVVRRSRRTAYERLLSK
jgi:hypothetical protein